MCPKRKMEKAVATKITKRQTTQTLQEKLSEIDWDLLEEMDQEEEGQVFPMQDPSSNKTQLPSSTPVLMTDHPGPVVEGPPPGRLSQAQDPGPQDPVSPEPDRPRNVTIPVPPLSMELGKKK